MFIAVSVAAAVLLLLLIYLWWTPIRRKIKHVAVRMFGSDPRPARVNFIAAYEFPELVRNSFIAAHPHLGPEPVDSVFLALKDFFVLRSLVADEQISMPSHIVASAWNIFAKDRGRYEIFCIKAFGRLLPPHEAPEWSSVGVDPGIIRTWWLLSTRLNIDPRRPARLPRLFALDRRLEEKGGVLFALNATDKEHIGGAAGIILLPELGDAAWKDSGTLDWARAYPIQPPDGGASAAFPVEYAPGDGDFAGGGALFTDVGGGGDIAGD